MARRLTAIAALIATIALACSGGESSATSDPAAPVTTDGAVSASEPSAPTSTVDSDGGASLPTDAESPRERLGLSPLASEVEPLPSALPERVLPELAAPTGTPPVALSLPSIGIDLAPIDPVGLEPNGELEVPGASTIGWYEFGVGVGGGEGSAVLAAHIAYNGVDGVFRDLADVQPGELVTLVVDGTSIDYRIDAIEQYGKADLPFDDLFRESGSEQLVLITCGGSFNPNLRSYDDNVVVIATPL